MQWYDRGFNKMFPVLIPTLDFRWDTPFALDPRTFEVTWMSPNALQAGWEEHNHVAFAKANALVSGMKKNFLDMLLPILTVLILLIAVYLIWSGNNAINHNFQTMQQQFNQIPGYVPK
jgi:TRAP-type C4-dicarboxylate transport system permease small subunit